MQLSFSKAGLFKQKKTNYSIKSIVGGVFTDWNEMYKKFSLEKIPWHSEEAPVSLKNAIENVPRGKALDVCSGTGTNSIFLAMQGFDVTGIDISKKAVEIAGKRAIKEKTKINFKVENALELKDRGKFEFVFDRGCFHHMPPDARRKFIANIAHSLKKNGKFQLMAFSENNSFRKGFTKQQIKDYFSRQFKTGKITEETHAEPDGNRVFLYVTTMTKK